MGRFSCTLLVLALIFCAHGKSLRLMHKNRQNINKNKHGIGTPKNNQAKMHKSSGNFYEDKRDNTWDPSRKGKPQVGSGNRGAREGKEKRGKGEQGIGGRVGVDLPRNPLQNHMEENDDYLEGREIDKNVWGLGSRVGVRQWSDDEYDDPGSKGKFNELMATGRVEDGNWQHNDWHYDDDGEKNWELERVYDNEKDDDWEDDDWEGENWEDEDWEDDYWKDWDWKNDYWNDLDWKDKYWRDLDWKDDYWKDWDWKDDYWKDWDWKDEGFGDEDEEGIDGNWKEDIQMDKMNDFISEDDEIEEITGITNNKTEKFNDTAGPLPSKHIPQQPPTASSDSGMASILEDDKIEEITGITNNKTEKLNVTAEPLPSKHIPEQPPTTSPDSGMVLTDSLHPHQAINANIETLRDILSLMEIDKRNLQKQEEYSLHTLKTLVETMSLADSFLDGDRSWVCAVVKETQMLQVLKDIVRKDTKFLGSLMETQDDSGADSHKNGLETTVIGVLAEETATLKTGTNNASDEVITIDDVIAIDGVTTNDDVAAENAEVESDEANTAPDTVAFDEGVENDEIKEDHDNYIYDDVKIPEADDYIVQPEKPSHPGTETRPILIGNMTGIDTDADKAGPLNFQLLGTKSEKKLPLGLSRSRRDSATGSKKEDNKQGVGVTAEDSKDTAGEGIASQIIYKRMFFSFLGKMCGIDILV